jgi:ankyrin repeat protein
MAMMVRGVCHANRVANICVALLTILFDSLSKPSPQNPAMLTILNAQNKSGNTALHWAALNGHLQSVKKLLENGADPTITNQKGHDAVYEAELNDKKEVVEWVLKEGGEGLEEGFGGDTEHSGPVEADEEEGEEPSKTANGSMKLEDTIDKLDIKEGSPSVAS